KSLTFGLQLNAPGCVVRGLIINNFFEAGIVLNADNSTVAGDFIGTNAQGTLSRVDDSQDFRCSSAIRSFSSGNTIGGSAPADVNVLGGCIFPNRDEFFGIGANAAVALLDGVGNTIFGNLIGIDKNGQSALGGTSRGIAVRGSVFNVIQNNVISGCG